MVDSTVDEKTIRVDLDCGKSFDWIATEYELGIILGHIETGERFTAHFSANKTSDARHHYVNVSAISQMSFNPMEKP